ncbi:MAG: cysteine synthase family protein [Anaerolineales bacterium]|nr:cysteine synthase family protein [Anaerolineales bacterium]
MTTPTLNSPEYHPVHIPATKSLEASVGNTPLVRLRHVTRELPKSVQIYAKTEWTNPGGSVKDRAALFIIRDAEKSGYLTPSMTLLDSTSGNMGISYATFAAARGYQVTLCLPDNVSPERKKTLQALGAELIFTDAMEGSDGAIIRAREILAQDPDKYYYADQYNNPSSWHGHYHTTGPEIINQTQNRVTHFLCGLGTSGTMMGAGSYIKEHDETIKIIAIQPEGPFHGIEGLKHMESSIKPGFYDANLPDIHIPVRTEDALDMTRRLAKEEGLLVGISSGAAAFAAIESAKTLEEGVIVTIFGDNGYKYLSDRFWTDGNDQ